MIIYERQLKQQVHLLKELGKQEYKGEEEQACYSRFYHQTVNLLKEYLHNHFKNIKAYKYWTHGDRVLTLFDGNHDKQIDIVLGR